MTALQSTRTIRLDVTSLNERAVGLLAVRSLAATGFVLVQFVLVPPTLIDTRMWLGALAYIAVSGACCAAASTRLGSFCMTFSLLLDGVFFEGRYAHGAPLGGIITIAVYMVAIVILLPTRLALLVALWHSVLAVLFSRILAMDSDLASFGPTHNVVAFVSVLWLAVTACAVLKAMNEGELRRRRNDAEVLRRFAVSLAGLPSVAGVQDRLLEFCHDELGALRAAWLSPVEPHGFQLARGLNLGVEASRTNIGVSALLTPLVGEAPARVVYRLGIGDEWLSRLFPDARRIIAAPLPSLGVPGWVVLEHDGRGNRLERRVVSNVAQACAAAALACSSANVLDQLRTAAATDGLTGRANRRTFDETMARLRHHDESMPVSVILADIDHFKQVNDVHGHQTGDAVLQAVGRILGQTARANDLVARYGGEEFVIVLPQTTAPEASQVAERMRRRIHANGLPLRVSISLGVADAYNVLEFDDVVARADTALYRAKSAGRNQVILDSRESSAAPPPSSR